MESEQSTVARRRLKQEADVSHAQLIQEAWASLADISRRIAADGIAAANVTRHLGRNFAEWMDREQMRFEQFEEFYRKAAPLLPEGLKSSHVHKFVAAWRQFPEEVTDFATANAVLRQMTFFAVGLMEEPKRLEPQTAAAHTPYKLFLDAARKEREYFEAWVAKEPMDQWDDAAWQIVHEETKFAAEIHATAKKKVGGCQ